MVADLYKLVCHLGASLLSHFLRDLPITDIPGNFGLDYLDLFLHDVHLFLCFGQQGFESLLNTILYLFRIFLELGNVLELVFKMKCVWKLGGNDGHHLVLEYFFMSLHHAFEHFRLHQQLFLYRGFDIVHFQAILLRLLWRLLR